MSGLRFSLAQLNPTLGDLDGNIALIDQAARAAHADRADFVIFSELTLTAYAPGDILQESDFLARCAQAINALCEATRQTPGLYWVIGAPTRRAEDALVVENSLLVLRDGQVVLSYAKQALSTTPIADERRYFSPGGQAAPTLCVQGVNVGFLIGDEAIVSTVNWLENTPTPDLVVSIQAKASSRDTRDERHRLYAAASLRDQRALVCVNPVGGHDELVYAGGSFAVTPNEGVVYEAALFRESLTSLQWDGQRFLSAQGEILSSANIAPAMPVMAFYQQQITLGLRDYARRCGFTQVVVGSSGGIDSALTLALAVEALGAANVLAITMPSRFSSEGSVSDSQVLCQNLGITLVEHPIHALVTAYEAGFAAAFQVPLEGLALENLQARIRGTVLMECANSSGRLLLSTGNKSEIAVGYCTLYGDTNGGLNLLGDLYKTEVFALSRYMNERSGRALIPPAIIDKEPSAELAPGQFDRNSLPPYPELDVMLKKLIEGEHLSQAEQNEVDPAYAGLLATPAGRALVTRVKTMIARSEHKRHQAAPILRLRERAFGQGWQRPIAAKYL